VSPEWDNQAAALARERRSLSSQRGEHVVLRSVAVPELALVLADPEGGADDRGYEERDGYSEVDRAPGPNS